MSDDHIRQHKRMAMGEDISGQTSGDKTHQRYAGGGRVKGAHKPTEHHGHRDMHAHHPQHHHGGHKRSRS